tara:strand:- start:348 stop:509 length:162 start_codon:yes stop_codon:yes gene_type:complete
MPGKKTMKQAKKLGIKAKGYKAGKKITMPAKKKVKIPKPFEIGRLNKKIKKSK